MVKGIVLFFLCLGIIGVPQSWSQVFDDMFNTSATRNHVYFTNFHARAPMLNGTWGFSQELTYLQNQVAESSEDPTPHVVYTNSSGNIMNINLTHRTLNTVDGLSLQWAGGFVAGSGPDGTLFVSSGMGNWAASWDEGTEGIGPAFISGMFSQYTGDNYGTLYTEARKMVSGLSFENGNWTVKD